MTAFIDIIKQVLENEGGYVNDPDDAGGETKYGITKKQYLLLDIKNLTKEEAIEIYKRDYWTPSKASSLPHNLQYAYFDTVVNCGQGTAVKILQRAAGAKVDGMIGPKTIARARFCHLVHFQAYRVLYYASIVVHKPSQKKFWLGWFKRAIR